MEHTRPPWEQTPAPPAAAPAAPAAPRRSARMAKRTAALAAAATAVVIAGWLGVAVADNTTTTTPPSSNGAVAPNPSMPGPGGPGRMGKLGHPGGPRGPEGMGGMKGAIHGQFTVPNGTGYRTMDTQRGTVTDVSSSSIKVKSDDGFEKTYSVTTNTLVNAGRDGIGSVKKGDTVAVEAVEGSGNPEAMHIMDQTTTKAIHDHWAPTTTTSTP